MDQEIYYDLNLIDFNGNKSKRKQFPAKVINNLIFMLKSIEILTKTEKSFITINKKNKIITINDELEISLTSVFETKAKSQVGSTPRLILQETVIIILYFSILMITKLSLFTAQTGIDQISNEISIIEIVQNFNLGNGLEFVFENDGILWKLGDKAVVNSQKDDDIKFSNLETVSNKYKEFIEDMMYSIANIDISFPAQSVNLINDKYGALLKKNDIKIKEVAELELLNTELNTSYLNQQNISDRLSCGLIFLFGLIQITKSFWILIQNKRIGKSPARLFHIYYSTTLSMVTAYQFILLDTGKFDNNFFKTNYFSDAIAIAVVDNLILTGLTSSKSKSVELLKFANEELKYGLIFYVLATEKNSLLLSQLLTILGLGERFQKQVLQFNLLKENLKLKSSLQKISNNQVTKELVDEYLSIENEQQALLEDKSENENRTSRSTAKRKGGRSRSKSTKK